MLAGTVMAGSHYDAKGALWGGQAGAFNVGIDLSSILASRCRLKTQPLVSYCEHAYSF